MPNVGIDASMLERDRTGIGNYVFNLLVRYRRVRPEARVVLFSNGRVSDEARALGDCVDGVFSPLRKGPLWLSTGLPALLREHRIDVFWGGNGYLPLVVPRGIRQVVTIHDFVYRHAGHTLPRISLWSRRVLQPLAIRQANAVVCVSQSTADELLAHHGRAADAVLEPPIDPSYKPAGAPDVDAVCRRYELPARFLLTTGTLEPRKNLVVLLSAYVRAREAGAELPLLVLAGKLGWLADDIRAAMDDAAARGFVRFLGYVPLELMPALYSAAEAFVFLPLYEGFGMPAREALLCGTPVIASDIAALREATGGLARLVSPDRASIERLFREYPATGPPPARAWPAHRDESLDEAAERFAAVLAP
ncbi:MAG TPA: glycosyltransferase family 1 protein [Gammaproteobacteria bacterium]|nr:glycosyltransferase family 1 protein [Gammaproteobacteria bacterium]